MSNILLITVSLLAGMVMGRLKSVPAGAHQGLNAFVIYVSLPAVTLLYVPKLALTWQMLLPFAMPWLLLLMAWGFFHALGKWLAWTPATVGVLTLVCGLGNVSFVGYPVLQAMYGEEGLKVGLFVGQGGFLAVSTLGLLLAAFYSLHRGQQKVSMAGQLLRFPPFLSFLLAIFLAAIGWQWPTNIAPTLEALGQTLTPLTMASIGLQWQWRFKALPWREIGIGLAYKLVLGPLILWGIYASLLGKGLLIQVTIVEAAMPPMVTAAIIAGQYRLRGKLANLLVGLGLFFSVCTLYMWHILLQ